MGIGSALKSHKDKVTHFSTIPGPEWTLNKTLLAPIPSSAHSWDKCLLGHWAGENHQAWPRQSLLPVCQTSYWAVGSGLWAPVLPVHGGMCSLCPSHRAAVEAMGVGAVMERLTLLPGCSLQTCTYQLPWEAPASGPHGAGHRTEPWTVAHLGPERAQRWPLVPAHPEFWVTQGRGRPEREEFLCSSGSPHSHPSAFPREPGLGVPLHSHHGGAGVRVERVTPLPGVCELFYSSALLLPASCCQRSSWPRPVGSTRPV